ncbi:MAG: DUF1501 domain-containing protein [Planctomycetaceae bacterium]|nr:DUF1501 domain-containing protein [Planctomycetaceae bacterium]
MNFLHQQLQYPGFRRRDWLKWHTVAGLSFLLPSLSARAAEQRGSERARSLICLWMNGGPSQLEMWDPHPGTEIGGPTTAIKTSIPEIEIGSGLPLMAERIHRLNLIRSLVSKEGDHERGTYFVKTGYRPDPTVVHPSLGSVITYQKPTEGLDLPPFVSLGDGQWPARGGYLGAQYDAFRVFDPGRGIHNMQSRVGEKRQEQRLEGLDLLTKTFRQGRGIQAEKSLHKQTIDNALKMMSSDQLKAFEIEAEPESTRDRYGDTQFGRGCLVARRLIETGVRAVEVTLSGFDTHANNFEGQAERIKDLDPAFAALMDDLIERDLFESTIVLCIGEFGRTPRINPLDGRDHWPNGFSCVLGGGGLVESTVIGETDPTGKATEPVNPVKVQDLYATILTQLQIDPAHEMMTPIGRPLAICDGAPLELLLKSS